MSWTPSDSQNLITQTEKITRMEGILSEFWDIARELGMGGVVDIATHNNNPDAHALLFGNKISIKLTANTTFYVNGATGNNSNNGLTSAAPFKAIQYAIDTVSTKYDLGRYNATIQIAGGSYDEDVAIAPYVAGNGVLTLQGSTDINNPTIVLGCVYNIAGKILTANINNLTIRYNGRSTPTQSTWASLFFNGGYFNLSSIVIDPTSDTSRVKYGLYFNNQAFTYIRTGLEVLTGQFSSIFYLGLRSTVSLQVQATANGTTTRTIYLGPYSRFDAAYPVTGSLTGRRADVGAFAMLDTRGAGESIIAGTTAAVVDPKGDVR